MQDENFAALNRIASHCGSALALSSNLREGAFRQEFTLFQVADLAGKLGGVGIVSHHDNGLALFLVQFGEDGEHFIGRL